MTSNLLDSIEVRISVIQGRFSREDGISPGWDDRCCSSFPGRFVDFTTVIPTICREALHLVRHLVQQPRQRCGISDRGIGEFHGQNVPVLVSGHMQLYPAPPAAFSPLRGRPLSNLTEAPCTRWTARSPFCRQVRSRTHALMLAGVSRGREMP